MKRRYRIMKKKLSFKDSETNEFTRFEWYYFVQKHYWFGWVNVTGKAEEKWKLRNAIHFLIAEERELRGIDNIKGKNKKRNYR